MAVVWLLHATDLPLTFRVVASGDALSEFAKAARESGPRKGRVGLVVVFDSRVKDGCVFLTEGYSLDGIAGLVHAPGASEPPNHPDWAATDSRHLTGPWWYFPDAHVTMRNATPHVTAATPSAAAGCARRGACVEGRAWHPS